ncbi:hypothetical protein [Salinarimonas soli]|uniref:Uncharacterized protein n=1 Tax=Salinarimonas soli TaxID=1638099 RepID=A0A5B2VAJ2_9HYPH|nr:hypothetical protein [Salinarimonas soli]KAA2236031.1 hypothetical protein F0L46_16790 [Salinarimonas soli]
MIDIVKSLREQHPDLGPYIVALRADSAVVAGVEPPELTGEARAWMDAHAPQGRLVRRMVRLHGSAGAEERAILVAAFPDARALSAFALAWT